MNASPACTCPRCRQDRDYLVRTVEALKGYLLNAKIDLETGAPKRMAIATIAGGLKVADAALSHATLPPREPVAPEGATLRQGKER